MTTYCPSANTYSLLVVDLSVIPPEELNRNYTPRGGKQSPESEEKAVQEQRELKTLMVIYTSSSDIPPSPREPIEQDSDDFSPEQSFGSPEAETKVSRSVVGNLFLFNLNLGSGVKILCSSKQPAEPSTHGNSNP